MIYLITQTWLFLAIACLIGMLMSYFLVWNQKTERQAQLEAEAHDARHRAITMEKEIEEMRGRLAELEGLPASARASRIAAREEMAARIAELEAALAQAQANEKTLGEERARLSVDVETFRQRYLEARARWDEYKARADALAGAAQPLDLGTAQIVPEDGLRKRVLDLEGQLAIAGREQERINEHARSLAMRVRDLERQLASAAQGSDARTLEAMRAMQVRASELEGQIAQATREREASALQTQQMLTRIRELEAALASTSHGREKDSAAPAANASRLRDLEASLVLATRERDQALQQLDAVTGRLALAERQVVAAAHAALPPPGDGQRELQARIAELEARLAGSFASAREADTLRSRVLDLQDKLSIADVALSKSLDRLRLETEPLRTRIAELETRLAHAAATNTQGDTIAVLQSADNVEMRQRLAEAEARADALATEVQGLTQRLAALPAAGEIVVADPAEAQRLSARVGELEQALAAARQVPTVDPAALAQAQARVLSLEGELAAAQATAAEAATLRGQVNALATELAAARQQAQARAADDEAAALRLRLADVEARLQAQASSAGALAQLQDRMQGLEALLAEAARAREDVVLLRAKVAELDSRLQAPVAATATPPDTLPTLA